MRRIQVGQTIRTDTDAFGEHNAQTFLDLGRFRNNFVRDPSGVGTSARIIQKIYVPAGTVLEVDKSGEYSVPPGADLKVEGISSSLVDQLPDPLNGIQNPSFRVIVVSTRLNTENLTAAVQGDIRPEIEFNPVRHKKVELAADRLKVVLSQTDFQIPAREKVVSNTTGALYAIEQEAISPAAFIKSLEEKLEQASQRLELANEEGALSPLAHPAINVAGEEQIAFEADTPNTFAVDMQEMFREGDAPHAQVPPRS